MNANLPLPLPDDARPGAILCADGRKALCEAGPVSTGGFALDAPDRVARIKDLAKAFGNARCAHGSGEPVRRAWAAFVNELERL